MAKSAPSLTVLVLAAGQGKRLRSKTIKLLHPVAGRPMLAHVLEAARAQRPSRLITVVGYQADRVRATIGDLGGDFVLQREQRGTGHAVLVAGSQVGRGPRAALLIVNGDVPTLRASTLRKLLASHRRRGAALSLLTADVDDPRGYGRIVRDTRGGVCRIVEARDASSAEAALCEINSGIYCADPSALLRVLRELKPDNAQGEYYLTDAVHALIEGGSKVLATKHTDADELLGVNTRQELAHATRTLYDRKAEELQSKGVTILDVSRTWIDPRAAIGRDTVIYPDVIVEGKTVLGEDCVVRSGSRLDDSRIGRNVEIRDHCVLSGATVGADVTIGPFAHLRPGAVLQPDSRVGNFVELKNTRLGQGSKANHLSYLGDARIGPGCNIGAGTITCNYDGKHKHPTTLGQEVFIGSNTQLVAPVHVRSRAYVAAGSTVTDDVPAGALAIARSRQTNITGWAERAKKGKTSRPGRKGKKPARKR